MGGHRVHLTEGYKYYLLGNCKYLHTQISILVHSEHCLESICALRCCDICAFDSEQNLGLFVHLNLMIIIIESFVVYRATITIITEEKVRPPKMIFMI